MKYTCMLFIVVIMVFAAIGNGNAQSSLVKMNEIYSRGVPAAPDWIEIYNGSTTQIDISGYKIYDSGGQAGTKPKMALPTGSLIPAKSFLVVVTDISTSVDPSGFGLSSGGETVWLENGAGALVDSITFTAMDTSQTYGRMPDGGNWKLLNTISRGSSNSLVLMNEIYSRGVPTDPDWIELYNSTSAQIDISGYKIYDSGGQAATKPKMAFPTGTVIPAKGFVVVVTDISTSVDPRGFGLSSGGETVWLEDKTGAIIDSVTFAAMDTVQSYSRMTDGRVWQLVNKRTRGASNGTRHGDQGHKVGQHTLKLVRHLDTHEGQRNVQDLQLELEGIRKTKEQGGQESADRVPVPKDHGCQGNEAFAPGHDILKATRGLQ